MRLSANLGMLWPELTLLERIEAAARAGFSAIELHWPYDTPAADLCRACDDHALALLSLNTTTGDVTLGEFGLGALSGREAEFRDDFRHVADYARAASASFIHVMAGVTNGDRRTTATFLDNLAFACAAAPDLTLLLEPMNSLDRPGYFYSTSDEAAQIIRQVGAANLKILFDCYHVGRDGHDVLAQLERCLPDIGHVQIAAVPDRGEPDASDLDHRAVFQALDRLGYDGWVGCEYRPRGNTDAGLVWIERLGVSF